MVIRLEEITPSFICENCLFDVYVIQSWFSRPSIVHRLLTIAAVEYPMHVRLFGACQIIRRVSDYSMRVRGDLVCLRVWVYKSQVSDDYPHVANVSSVRRASIFNLIRLADLVKSCCYHIDVNVR
jgi:hypothetical protein